MHSMYVGLSARWAAVACVISAMATPVGAQGSGNGPAVISKRWHVQYDVAADGRTTATYETINQIQQANALERLKAHSFSYSTSIQKGEILQAYTLKADGRKIQVPANNYQTESSEGRNGNQPLFSDRSRITVVFPDVAVGDSVQVRYRIEDKEPMFPGAFSVVQGFSAYGVHEDSRITIKAPKGLDLRLEAHGLTAEPETHEGETVVRSWTYKNAKPRPWSDADAGVWRLEESPVLLASTFTSYEAIAQAYGDRALPKAKPTDRIKDLAKTIVGDVTEPREKARLLYEWVSTQITYGGNCIGVGAVVPRDLDVVLDNKMGDCKDHATLLQALLNAADIRSEQVLINAGEVYDLPDTPVVSTVNHVINYLPDFQLYVDATAKQIPFGLLPTNAYGKPVIHVGNPKALAQIPPGPASQTQQTMRMRARVQPDGSASGEVNVRFKGTLAAKMREYMHDLDGDAEREFVRKTLAANGYKAQGVLNKGDMADSKALSDEYAFSFTFDIDNYLQGGARGAFALDSVIQLPLSISQMARERDHLKPNRRVSCYGYVSRETFEFELQPGVSFDRLPASPQAKGQLLHYSVSAQKTGSGLTIERELRDDTPKGLCSVDYSAQWADEAKPIAEHLQQQMFYQRSSAKTKAHNDRQMEAKADKKGSAKASAKNGAKGHGKASAKESAKSHGKASGKSSGKPADKAKAASAGAGKAKRR